MTRLVTISNDIHNTTTRLRCEVLQHVPGECVVYPTRHQLSRARRSLCGMSDCCCGGWHGPQEYGGTRLVIDASADFMS